MKTPLKTASKRRRVLREFDLVKAENRMMDFLEGHYGMREATDLIRRLIESNQELLVRLDKANAPKKPPKPYVKRGPKKPCHFCKKPTTRLVRFGYLTFDTACCARCEHR